MLVLPLVAPIIISAVGLSVTAVQVRVLARTRDEILGTLHRNDRRSSAGSLFRSGSARHAVAPSVGAHSVSLLGQRPLVRRESGFPQRAATRVVGQLQRIRRCSIGALPYRRRGWGLVQSQRSDSSSIGRGGQSVKLLGRSRRSCSAAYRAVVVGRSGRRLTRA